MRDCSHCGKALDEKRRVLCVECVRILMNVYGISDKVVVAQEVAVFLTAASHRLREIGSQESILDIVARTIRELEAKTSPAPRALLAAMARATRTRESERYRERVAAGENWRKAAIHASQESLAARALELRLEGGRLIEDPAPEDRERISRLRVIATKRANSIKVAASQRKTGKRK